MRVGQKVTQLRFVGVDLIRHFTGTIIDVPDTDRGCRTKITVEIDGDPQKLWQNWSDGLHRQTVYGTSPPISGASAASKTSSSQRSLADQASAAAAGGMRARFDCSY